jgi:glutaredoxin 3
MISVSKGFSQDIITASKTISNEKKVLLVYGSGECHHCIATKEYLEKNKIPFEFFDIDKNPEALKEMLTKLRAAHISTNNLQIPVIDKQGEIFTNSEDFEGFLKKLN